MCSNDNNAAVTIFFTLLMKYCISKALMFYVFYPFIQGNQRCKITFSRWFDNKVNENVFLLGDVMDKKNVRDKKSMIDKNDGFHINTFLCTV